MLRELVEVTHVTALFLGSPLSYVVLMPLVKQP